MYGVFLFGYLSEEEDILTFMRDKVSKDANWRVQEVLAKAFDEFCKKTGYEKSLPIIDHAISADDASFPARATLQQPVDFIVKLLNDAIACEDFPWSVPENEMENWDGRMTKAGAMALKTRVLLFVASPLFNSDAPFAKGEASDKKMTWWGNYDKQRWKQAVDACKEFFDALNKNGFFKLVQAGDHGITTEREAYTSAYFDRGNTETLQGVRGLQHNRSERCRVYRLFP